MAQGTIKSRFQLKNDIEANWNKAKNFIPLKGEIIIYSIDESHPFSRLKIGDGITKIIDLPFISADFINGYQIIADTAKNWENNLSYIPNNGDIIIWLDKTISNGLSIPGIKIGDGITQNIKLPFVGDDIVKLSKLINIYSKCISGAEEQEKRITVDGFELINGMNIHVTFINGNKVLNPVLKINDLDPIPFFINNNEKELWSNNETITLTYDGEFWRINSRTGPANKLTHKLIFGSGQQFIFDGTKDVTVPVYTGAII